MSQLIQRCLILGLCVFPPAVWAVTYHVDTEAEAWSACGAKAASNPDSSATCFSLNATTIAYGNESSGFHNFSWNFPEPEECNEVWSHQPDPITGEVPPSPKCTCAVGWTDSGEGNMPRCVLDRQQEPQECYENGQYYDKGRGYCVLDCPTGVLDQQCLEMPDPDQPDCSPTDSDYVGSIGYGGEAMFICGDPQNKCPSGYTFGVVSTGTTTSEKCIPNEYRPPQCSGSDVLTVDQWGGHSCLPPNTSPDNPSPGGDDDPSNGDSDGDGQADTNGIAGQLQDIKSLISRGNTDRNTINETLKGLGKQMGEGIGSITDAIGNIPGGGGNGSGGDGGEGEGEQEDPVTWSGDPIDTELTDPTDDYDQVMNDYQAKINEIKGEVQAMFSTNLSGGGSVDDNIKNIHGVEVNFSLNRFLDGFNILGSIVLFCAAFISAGILFTSRG